MRSHAAAYSALLKVCWQPTMTVMGSMGSAYPIHRLARGQNQGHKHHAASACWQHEHMPFVWQRQTQAHARSAQVWAPMHWIDIERVPEQWREGQYPADILRYNELTSAAARASNLTVFDTYNLTRGGTTLDGVHVPPPVSLSKLQLLLSMLEARQPAAAALT